MARDWFAKGPWPPTKPDPGDGRWLKVTIRILLAIAVVCAIIFPEFRAFLLDLALGVLVFLKYFAEGVITAFYAIVVGGAQIVWYIITSVFEFFADLVKQLLA